MAFRRKRDFVKDAWCVFDSVLVCTMVTETWVVPGFMILSHSAGGSMHLKNVSIMRLARLLRLTRMSRMVRVFRAMPELLILIKGMLASTRSVFFIFCLAIILFYVFGVLFRQLTHGNAVLTSVFSSVPGTMYFLLIHGTF